MSEPREPEWSCPHLDSAIEEIENARKIHEELRKWGQWWKDAYEEKDKDTSHDMDLLNAEIGELKDKISDLESTISKLKAEIRDYSIL